MWLSTGRIRSILHWAKLSSILGIYPTFNLGQFYFTVTIYKLLSLVKPNGEYPAFVDPLFLHYHNTYSCYNSVSSG